MQTALQIKNLTKQYANGVQALKGIDLEVPKGDFFALLGSNGAGKSTVIGIIASLVNKTGGSVRIFDQDIDENPSKAKSYLGLVPQEFNFNIFEPIIEVIMNQAGFFGIDRKLAYERAEYYLNHLQLWDKHQESARQLSGGMKRRLMIARALVNNPRLLILDEPTAGVDVEIRQSMWTFLQKLNEDGTTIILTTHYLEEAEKMCRNIAIIDQGRIVENTSMVKLLQQVSSESYALEIEQHKTDGLTLSGFEFSWSSEQELGVEVSEGKDLNQLLHYLTKKNIVVKRIAIKQNRLESLFMNLVSNNNT